MSDDEAHFYDLRQTKLKRLRVLDKQAAMLGDAETPAHIQVERAQLRAELETVESVIGWSHARPSIGDELGPNGRFLAYMAETRRGSTDSHRAAYAAQRANDGIADLRDLVEDRFEQLASKMNAHRQWIILIGVVVVVILVAGAVVVTIVVMRGV